MTDNQRTIAGRYQVKDLIGRGGMADVYEGFDTRLGRVVAIKILKADLAADSSFEARFRQEAQASARMAHPTIVRVYDAGEEHIVDANGNQLRRPYIVMEFVRGSLLRDLISDRQLEIGEAVGFAEGVLTALEISHRSGVIHRDIKSANIMITETGQVKVMDFGIARAITDSSATQAHTGGIVGTAQYFSPEQAKGETVDSRTDLYSTGVLLYEMLTGRPPFRGETAVSVAYQHVSEPVIAPSTINPHLSPELDSVVLRALAKDRNERFQSAEQFREHLLAAFAVSRDYVAPETAAQPAASTSATQIIATDSAANAVSPEGASAPTEVFGFEDLLNAAVEEAHGGSEQPAAPTHADTDSNPYSYGTGEVSQVSTSSSRAVESGASGSAGEHTNPFKTIGIEFEADVEPESRRERRVLKASTGTIKAANAGTFVSGPKTPIKSLLWAVIAGLTVILLGLGIWSLSTLGNIKVNVPTSGAIAVPDVSGKTYDEAYTILNDANLLVHKTYQASDTVALDTVISFDPPAGTQVSAHTTVNVFVSGGKASVKVPYLVGTLEKDAPAALTAVGLTLGKITQQNSPDKTMGTILSSTPAEYAQLPKGTAVDLVVSTGKVTVPSVLQQSVTAAKSVLTGSNIGYTVSVESSSTTCTGTLGQIVTGQSIAPGDGEQHQNIVLYVDCIGGNVVPSTTPSPSPTL